MTVTGLTPTNTNSISRSREEITDNQYDMVAQGLTAAFPSEEPSVEQMESTKALQDQVNDLVSIVGGIIIHSFGKIKKSL